MSEIRDLLNADTRAKLAQVTAQQQDKEPAFVIIKASTDPNPPRPLTAADAIEIDPESEAMIDTQCVDCEVPMLLDPVLPEDSDPEDKHKPRVPLCKKCGAARARFAAINEQRNVEVIQRKHRTAQRQPRTTDGIDHPVTVTTKENEMYDLEQPDAVVGAAVKQGLKQEIADALPAKVAKAKAKQRKADKDAKAAIKKRQKAHKNLVLAEFVVDNSLTVPALDLSEVTDVNELVSSVLRAPYNSARFRLAGEPSLWPPSKDEEEGYTPTTYQTLIDEHGRLMALAAAKAAEKAKPKVKKSKPQIVAVLDDDVEAKVNKKAKALAKLTGISKDAARAIVMANL